MSKKESKKRLFKKTIAGIACFFMLLIMVPAAHSGGELRVAWDTGEMMDSLGLGSSWQYTAQGNMFWQMLYDQMWLLGPGPEYNTQHRAAVKFETDDNVKWRITLREGMTFHDGKPVTANDVAFTIEYLPISNPIWGLYDCSTKEKSITVIDDLTLEFEMKSKLGNKYPPFQFYPIMPKHVWKRHKFDMEKYDNKKGIGSGPFKLNEFKAGQYIVFDRFEDYWDKSPRADKLIFQGYGGADSILMAIKNGEADMSGYYGSSPLAIRFIKDRPDIKVIKTQGCNLNILAFNLHPDGPIRNLNTRKAIAHGMDLDAIIKMVYHGYAEKHDSYIYPELPEYNPNLPKYDLDPELANKLLDDAGYPDSDDDGLRNDPKTGDNIKIKFLVSSEAPENVKIATLFREQMKALKLGIDVRVVDLDTYYDLLFYPQGNAWDLGLSYAEPGPKADWVWEYMRSFDSGGAGWNNSYYNNPDFDGLIDALYAETDMEKRKEISFKMQEIMMEDLPYFVICRPMMLTPVRVDKLQGYETRYMGGIANWINPFSYYNVHAR